MCQIFLKIMKLNNKICTISNRNEGISYYTDINLNNCFIPFSELDKKKVDLFTWLYLKEKLIKGSQMDVKKFTQEKIKLNFSKEKITCQSF